MIMKLLVNSYMSIFISIGIASFIMLSLGFYFIFKPRKSRILKNKTPQVKSNNMAIPNFKNELQEDEDNLPWDDSLSAILRAPPKSITISSSDIGAISGEDVIATQLDLARAYLETGRKQLAKKMLEHVISQGNEIQQTEARHLLNLV